MIRARFGAQHVSLKASHFQHFSSASAIERRVYCIPFLYIHSSQSSSGRSFVCLNDRFVRVIPVRTRKHDTHRLTSSPRPAFIATSLTAVVSSHSTPAGLEAMYCMEPRGSLQISRYRFSCHVYKTLTFLEGPRRGLSQRSIGNLSDFKRRDIFGEVAR